MRGRKRLDASIFGHEVRDAIKEVRVVVTKAICRRSVPGDPERCALVLAAKEQGSFVKFTVHRTVAYGLPEGSKIMLRWQSSSQIRLLVEKFDKGDYSDIPADGLLFIFYPPRKALSLDYLRSEHRRKLQRESQERTKNKDKRPYRLPDPKTLAGVRNRFGFHS